MIDTPTLFILGAGASCPYCYHSGLKLREDIIRNFQRDFDSLKDRKATLRAETTGDQINDFLKSFSNSPRSISIDKFLAFNPSFSSIGKIAITLSILKCQIKSCFNEDMNINEDWYSYLWGKMTYDFKSPEDYDNFWDNKVAFITFNYDSSLEYFLYNSFYNSFFQSRPVIQRQLDRFKTFEIIHVYGALSELSLSDWYNNSQDYYEDHRKNFLSQIQPQSENIRVIGDRSLDDIKDRIKSLLKANKRIFFLGFSYAPENLEAIDLMNNIDHTWNIFGDAKDMTPKEIQDVKNRLPFNKGAIYAVPGAGSGSATFDTSVYATIENTNSNMLLREYL